MGVKQDFPRKSSRE